jgi:uncharacterized membrane protein YebE (DUF533 family)
MKSLIFIALMYTAFATADSRMMQPCSPHGSHYYSATFAEVERGRLPCGWKDLGVMRSSPNWGVDGRGLLRVLWKEEQGVIAYSGIMADSNQASDFRDGSVTARFKKTPDREVYVAAIGRARDKRNYYSVKFSGDSRLELVKVSDGEANLLQSYVTRSRLQEGMLWTLCLSFNGPQITGRVLDDKGIEQARVDGFDPEGFTSGMPGLAASTFAAFESVRVEAAEASTPLLSKEQIATKNISLTPRLPPCKVLTPATTCESLNTAVEQLAEAYDVVVAGAGTGGWAAAVQASRMGAKVLLLEESDWIGGQMAAAAVTSMDEEGCWEKFPVRERGLYREFHQSMINYYYTLDKDPFRAYYAWPEQLEGGYEPKVARAMLYAFIADARTNGTLDLALRSRVSAVSKAGETIAGVTVEHRSKSGAVVTRKISSKVLVEATEYGDVLPLTGARYRVGTTSSDNLDPASLVQYHTWVGVIREYPDGVPEPLKIKTPPPGYNPKKYSHKLWGSKAWGSQAKAVKKPRSYRNLLAWRGMADSDSPSTGMLTQERHTQCGLNGGTQDYPVTAASIEDRLVRLEGQREGIYRTLGQIYYLQQLGLPWSVADDEGYDTAYNRETMERLGLREDLRAIAVYLPQWPYVREARRARGLYTLRAEDLTRFEKAKLFPTSLAMGDYFMDLDHGPTAHAIEADLTSGEIPRGGGPFQVPFEVFIPETVDGLVLAEKNLSQSRHVNGATRLQPITMLTGQAAGALAAMAVRTGLQPRKVNPVAVQHALLAAGSNLIQRWYDDVSWGTELWQATQLLSLYGILDAPGLFAKRPEGSMGADQFWKPEAELERQAFIAAAKRLGELAGKPIPALEESGTVSREEVRSLFSSLAPQVAEDVKATAVTRGAFALAAARVTLASARPSIMKDPK